MLQQVYRDQTSFRLTVFLWGKRFKEKRENVKNNSRLSTSRTKTNFELMQNMVCGDRRLT